MLHNPSLPLLARTERRRVTRQTPPTSGSLKPLTDLAAAGRPDEAVLVSSSASSAPPPLLNLSSTECESCSDPSEGPRRRPTPDLLELSSKYETFHRQTLTRTQSGPSRARPLSNLQEQPRPWSDTTRIHSKPRQLEPILNPPHLVIPRQRGLTGLHLSCNYSAQPGRSVLQPITANREEEEDTNV